MKPWSRMIAMVLLIGSALAQTSATSIDGAWQGALVFGQGKVRVVLYVSPSRDGVYSGALVSLPGGEADKLDLITCANGEVGLEAKDVGFRFAGTLSSSGDEIKGKFTQYGISGDLKFTRESSKPSRIAEEYEQKEFTIPMRDGIHLHTVVFSPKVRTEELPFLIERSPYGWDSAGIEINAGMSELARDGYFLVFQDIRGRYQSEGQFVMQRPVRNSRDDRSIDEGTDTYDTIDWLLKNIPGNNGRAGIMGISYGGWLTEMALIEPHPALKAASEQASPADMFLGDDFHHNGAFRLSYGFEYAAMMETGKTDKTFQFQQFDTYDWYLKLGPLRAANARYFDGQRPTWNNFVAHFVNSPWYKLVLMALLVSATLLIGGRRSSGDFPVYYLAAQRLRNGDDLYRIVPDEVYSYPPFAAFVCVPLTFMPQRAAQWVWGGLQAIALVLVIHLALLLSRRERAALTPRQQVCLVGAAVLIGARHLLSPLENLQTDLMIALLCFAAVYWIGMGWPIAAVLGAAIGLKATPLLFVPFLLRWRQWKAATAAVVAAVVLNLAPSMIFPSPLPKLHAVEWIESLARPAIANGPAAARPGVWKEFTQLNQSLGGLLARLFINGAEDHRPLLWGLGHRGVQIVFLAIAALLMIGAATV